MMRITKIKLYNFKSFKGNFEINLDSPIVCLVGENNTGKTTIFKALEFLKSGVEKGKTINDYKHINNQNDDVWVEVTIQGENFKNIIEGFQGNTKYTNYIREENNLESIVLKRSSEIKTIKQGKKDIELNERKICIYSDENQQFENPTGIDTAIGSLLELIFVWPDMQTSDITDFSSAKILGKLIKDISSEFFETDTWKAFENAHEKAFKGDNSLSSLADNLTKEISSTLRDFYGSASIELNFQLPATDSFIKSGDVVLDDGMKTKLSEKGSGMQRAIALSVIKVYADSLAKHQENNELKKPLFFFIDEPEISLHPRAQRLLMSALQEISKYQQIFISTHSPYVISNFQSSNIKLLMIEKENHESKYKEIDELKTFSFSPTLAEINYFAYNIATTDFHNELYGYIEQHESGNYFKQLEKTHQRKRINKDRTTRVEECCLMTYVRHAIHHPENTLNPYTEEDLNLSINKMLEIIQDEKFQEKVRLHQLNLED